MTSSEFSSLQNRLQAYLTDVVANNGGSAFVKSRHIAVELNVSAKRVGAAIAALENDTSTPFSVHRRGGDSNGTTWHIKKVDNNNDQSLRE